MGSGATDAWGFAGLTRGARYELTAKRLGENGAIEGDTMLVDLIGGDLQ